MMTLMHYEPWSLINQLQREVNRLFEARNSQQRDDGSVVETSQWIPTVDIKEEQDRFILLADVPGVEPEAIEISMEGNVLTIKGARYSDHQEEGRKNFSRIERVQGRFSRVFTLPETADSENILARSHHGVLVIEIPKKEQAKPRKIAIKVDKGNKG
jgi:HSP20 family protein